MDTDDSRKRSANFEYCSSVKRLCQRSAASSNNGSPGSSNDSPSMDRPCIPFLQSVKDLLTVPLKYIFRQCPSSGTKSPPQHSANVAATAPMMISQQRSKPLLSRNEASCLIRIHTLAAELDSLIQLSAKVLMDQIEWMSFHDELARADIRPLRALLPILLTLGQTFVHQRLRSLDGDLAEVLRELETLGENLRQSREANWTTSEALLEVLATNAMALEKRHLGDIQDELAQRIDSLVQATILGETWGASEEGDEQDILSIETPKSMAEFCREVWKESNDFDSGCNNSSSNSVLSPLRHASSSSQNSRLSVEPTGKENAPSQQSQRSALVEEGPSACLGGVSASQHAGALALSSLAFSTTPN